MVDRSPDPAVCTVCGRIGTEATCVSCGWPLGGAPRSDKRHGKSGADPGLAIARRRIDLRAARLAAAGDPAVFAKTARLVRGGATAADLIDPAEQAPLTMPGGYPGRQVIAQLRALALGELHRLLFLQVRTDGLVATMVQADPIGVPHLADEPLRWRWRDLLANAAAADLAPDASALRFYLAGGVGEGSVLRPQRLLDKLAAQLPELPGPERGAVVLIPPDSRWRLLDQLADEVARRYAAECGGTGVDPDGDPTAQLAGILRHTPSRHDIDLVLLRVKQDGTVWLAPVRLFPAGTAVNGAGPPTAEVDVYVSGARRPVALPVVIRHDTNLPEQWTPLKVVQVAMPEPAQHRIRVAFDGPGDINFPALDGGADRPADAPPASWRSLLNRVPGTIAATSVDLVLAVELAEPGAAERLSFARRMLTEVAGSAWTLGGLRVAVAGYYQHLGRRRRREEEVRAVDWRGFNDPALGRTALDGWRPLANRNDFASAIEDLLAGVDRLAWRDAARRVLMLIGSRPPYPSQPSGDITQTCDYRLPWEEPAARLRQEKGVRLVSVWQRPPWRDTRETDSPVLARLAQARQLLGADGCFDLEHTTAAEVARVCALDGSLELDALPLALAAPRGTTP